MYLALCLSPESEQAIRTAVPAAGELHLTVIHSLKSLSTLEAWCVSTSSDAMRELRDARADLLWQTCDCKVFGTALFGGKTKVTALQLVMNERLEKLRVLAEAVLFDACIPWSKQWGFSPHITLGRGLLEITSSALPSVVTFDRMEWRE